MTPETEIKLLQQDMNYIKNEISEIKQVMKEGFASINKTLSDRDCEYNDKFATKDELGTAIKNTEKGSLFTSGIVQSVIVAVIIGLIMAGINHLIK